MASRVTLEVLAIALSSSLRVTDEVEADAELWLRFRFAVREGLDRSGSFERRDDPRFSGEKRGLVRETYASVSSCKHARRKVTRTRRVSSGGGLISICGTSVSRCESEEGGVRSPGPKLGPRS